LSDAIQREEKQERRRAFDNTGQAGMAGHREILEQTVKVEPHDTPIRASFQ
jgi:hypothetical protein